MPTLPLTRGLSAQVSAEDFERLATFKWYARPNLCGNHYAQRTVGRRTVYLHREIMGAAAGQLVDHINGDGLDNRRENLRLVTASQNSINARPRSASGFRGVERNPRGTRYIALIHPPGQKRRHLGTFDDPADAARAYDDAALAEYGALARLNFPDRERAQ